MVGQEYNFNQLTSEEVTIAVTAHDKHLADQFCSMFTFPGEFSWTALRLRFHHALCKKHIFKGKLQAISSIMSKVEMEKYRG